MVAVIGLDELLAMPRSDERDSLIVAALAGEMDAARVITDLTRQQAQAILDGLPVEAPEVVRARQAVLAGHDPRWTKGSS